MLAVHAWKADRVCSELGGRELVLCGQVSELAGVRRELIGMRVRRHVVRYDVHARHFVLLLPLHATILKPDLDLSLRQAQGMGNLDAPAPREVTIEVELFLELQGLIPRVRSPLTFSFAIGIYGT